MNKTRRPLHALEVKSDRSGEMHRFIIKNSGIDDAVLTFNDGNSVILKPNEHFSYEGEADCVPELEYGHMLVVDMDFGELSYSEGVEAIANTHYWNVTIPVREPITSGSWKKEGF